MARCFICDHNMSPKEIEFNDMHDDFDPCFTCNDVIRQIFPNDEDEGHNPDQWILNLVNEYLPDLPEPEPVEERLY